jgi:hypothetical protein
VPDERFLRICLNGITHTCMIHRWNEENKPHRNKDVVAMYCGHVFLNWVHLRHETECHIVQEQQGSILCTVDSYVISGSLEDGVVSPFLHS